MHRRQFMKAIGALGAAAVWAGRVCGADAAKTDKPTVLFIAINDLNHWVGYPGRPRQLQYAVS